MAKFYISFGQAHAHSVGGQTFDKDCLCLIEAEDEATARVEACKAFGIKWGTSYDESELADTLHYFPRGVLALVMPMRRRQR